MLGFAGVVGRAGFAGVRGLLGFDLGLPTGVRYLALTQRGRPCQITSAIPFALRPVTLKMVPEGASPSVPKWLVNDVRIMRAVVPRACPTTGRTTGLAGFGFAGVVGCAGFAGVLGLAGVVALAGVLGLTGLVEVVGFAGFAGVLGLAGLVVLAGALGRADVVGATGVLGFAGLVEVVGFADFAGVAGFTGLADVRGLACLVDFPGVLGLVALPGLTGALCLAGRWALTGVRYLALTQRGRPCQITSARPLAVRPVTSKMVPMGASPSEPKWLV